MLCFVCILFVPLFSCSSSDLLFAVVLVTTTRLARYVYVFVVRQFQLSVVGHLLSTTFSAFLSVCGRTQVVLELEHIELSCCFTDSAATGNV